MHDLSARELLVRYRAGDLSPVEVVDVLAARKDEFNALVTTAFDRAHADAAASDRRYRAGDALPLDGLPVVVKDLIDTAGLRTTYGSGMFRDHVPAEDAPIVARLRAAGAVVLAKSATHEFAWGITTNNEHFGPTRNPWAPDRVPGGSSGGSAAALAARLAPLALGTDTAGSIRIPAAFCGVVGFRPTHGSVDGRGIFPLAPSLDVVGPMARTVEDVRLLHPVPTVEATSVVVGLCQDLDQLPLGDAAIVALETAAAALAESGATVVERAAPGLPQLVAAMGVIGLAEGLHSHRQAGLWPSRAGEYGHELRTRLELAEHVELEHYLDAQADRQRVVHTLAALFETIDVLLSPASTVGPVPIGTDTVEHAGRTLSFREAVMTCTAPQSLAGLPACTVPVGRDADGLPVGVQISGRRGADALVLDVAERLQRALH